MDDGAALARKLDAEGRDAPFIFVKEFWVDYVPRGGEYSEVEWVSWGKKGVQNPSITNERISLLKKDAGNPIWQVIKPIYEKWKEGQASPVDGTPLAAWSGVTPALRKVLEPANIRSVEDIARMEDSAIQKLGVPNLRRVQQEARAFLEAQASTAGIAAENLKLKETVEAQAKQIDELRKAVEALADEETAPKKRGRPPKAA